MRKHPLIALTAFTALGASAIAGTTTGSFNSVLTSATSAGGHHPGSNATLDRASGRIKSHLPANDLKPSETDLLLVHDVSLAEQSHLSPWTGLPPVPGPKHAVALKAAVLVAPPVPAPVVTTTTTAPPAPAAPSGGVWYEIRVCESGDNYAEDTGNGYYGAYQFSLSTWYGLGYSGLPSEASPATQDQAAAELEARSGWGQWPECAAQLGLY
ncbi:MAG: transglycosylase family protein [Acidimicrobiales bacterium]|jgi:hypothetical protein